MTKLNSEKPVVRETAAMYRGREIVVEMFPGHMKFRFKGKQEFLVLDYEVAVECATKVEARERLAEKGVKI
jgi:hypothetical protein